MTTLFHRCGEGCQGRPKGGSSRPLTGLSAQHNRSGNEAKRSTVELRSLVRILLRPLTKTRLLESWMELLTPPAIYSIVNYTMIHVSNSPTLLGWGGRALTQFLDRLAPTTGCSGHPACELAAPGCSACAASNTIAPPTSVRWLLSPPPCRDGTLTVDKTAGCFAGGAGSSRS